MKNKSIQTLLILILNLGLQFNSKSQCISIDPGSPACNDIISTNPDEPINTERPEMKNLFDWRSSTLIVYHPNDFADANGNPSVETNPFFTDDDNLSNINFSIFPASDFLNPEVLDFHVEDGWELIHKGNGFKVNEIDLLFTVLNRNGPYFIQQIHRYVKNVSCI